MQFVKLVAGGTIDDKLLAMQKDKSRKIQEVISPEVLAGRDTDKQLLEWFGEIQQVKGGGIKIIPRQPGKKETPIIVD